MYVLSFSYFSLSFNLHTDSHINFNDLWNQSQNLILAKPLYTSTETQTILFTRKLLCRRQIHAWDPRILVQAVQTQIEGLRFTYTNHLSWVEIHTIPDSIWGCSFNKSLLTKLQELSMEYTTIAQNTVEFIALTPSWSPHASEPWSFDQVAKQSWFSPKVCISDLYWKRNFKHFRFKKGSLSRFWTFPWSYITKASRMTKKWTFPLLFCFFRKI